MANKTNAASAAPSGSGSPTLDHLDHLMSKRREHIALELRIGDIADEHCGLQPVSRADALLDVIEKKLCEVRELDGLKLLVQTYFASKERYDRAQTGEDAARFGDELRVVACTLRKAVGA
jgi:hypothetical protein